ncbi:hypothetical protein [Sorangium sp. So ce887]|uniref:hypothetical protein n=1 Tax=Sorangium sp. So ce887 TaxID=3133324 RepID=UPI003F60CEB7
MGIIVSGGLFAYSAAADHRPRPRRCSEATLKGSYIFAADGLNVTTGRRFASAGVEVFRGDGTMDGNVTVSIGRAIARVTVDGEYTIDAECRGRLTLTTSAGGEENYDFFTEPSGNEIRWIQTDPGIVASGSERRAE